MRSRKLKLIIKTTELYKKKSQFLTTYIEQNHNDYQ